MLRTYALDRLFQRPELITDVVRGMGKVRIAGSPARQLGSNTEKAMSGDSSKNYGGGIMIPGLTILFVGLKLGGVIGWSWWWVLSPLWIAAMIALLAIIVIAWAGSK